MKIHIEYFASLREAAARTEETCETDAATPLELYRELQTRYGFKLKPEHLAASVNEEIQPLNVALKPGDHIVFIPPIAGG